MPHHLLVYLELSRWLVTQVRVVSSSKPGVTVVGEKVLWELEGERLLWDPAGVHGVGYTKGGAWRTS